MNSSRIDRGALATVAITAAAICAFVFAIGGGQDVFRTGATLALTVLAITAVLGRLAFIGRLPRPFRGWNGIALLALLALVSSISITWSVLPGDTTVDASRTLAYAAILAAGALAAQLLPGRAREFAGGILAACVIICAYALVSRIAPSWFAASDSYARLRLPFEYWNAVGVVAGMGLIAAVWLGTARGLAKWVTALSYPAGGILAVSLALSQSRGAMVATIIAFALWLLYVPRRLRTVGWLGVIIPVSVIVVAWAYGQNALSNDDVVLAERESAGTKFALVLLVMIALLAAAGYAVEQFRRQSPLSGSRRYAIGRVMLVALAISPIVVAGALATTDKGLGDTVSGGVSDLFDANKEAPANTPSRLVQTSSLRARYWRDAFKIWGDHRLTGTGADTYSVARLPYRHDTIKVRHAHGFIPQTVSDLGVIGLLVVIALFGAWLMVAARALGGRRAPPYKWLPETDDERSAQIALVMITVLFGIHSLVDWTWYVPGTAAIALLAAGWTFGSFGTPSAATPVSEAAASDRTVNALRATGIALVGFAVAFAIYQPARAAHKVNQGYDLLANGHPNRALAVARDASDIDPTSDKPYYLIAAAQNILGRRQDADGTLADIATKQPANPETWIRLADYRLNVLSNPSDAFDALRPLLFLSPNNERGTVLFRQAKEARALELAKQQLEAQQRKLKREIKKLNAQSGATAAPPASP